MRGMTIEPVSEPAEAAPMNPYTVTLLWLWVGALVVAGILAIVGYSEAQAFAEDNGAAQYAWAALFALLGFGALVAWLLANAVRWQPPQS